MDNFTKLPSRSAAFEKTVAIRSRIEEEERIKRESTEEWKKQKKEQEILQQRLKKEQEQDRAEKLVRDEECRKKIFAAINKGEFKAFCDGPKEGWSLFEKYFSSDFVEETKGYDIVYWTRGIQQWDIEWGKQREKTKIQK